jgi:predicted metal-dependent RNase
LSWAKALQQHPQHTFIVHGDPAAGQELAKRLRHDLGFRNVLQPDLNQTVEIT